MAIFQHEPSSNGMRDADGTTIGARVKVSGTFTSDGDVQFYGVLENGEMQIKGCLTIGQGAVVNAKIKADRLILQGTVNGNVKTDGDVELGATGKLQGDLNAGGNLIIQPGGVFIGKSMMQDSQKDESTVKVEVEQIADLEEAEQA